MSIELPQWLESLRRSEITERVKNDPRSKKNKILGVDPDVAQREVLDGGQAEFDTPWNDLSPDDRVLLYAYYNQLGHLEELTEAFRMLFSNGPPEEEPIVVDLGCGPFTGGLALTSVLGPEKRFDYIGVDRSHAMQRFGEHLASTAQRLGKMPQIDRYWSTDISSVSWNSAPSWRPVLIIVSYLLASPTLNAAALIAELEGRDRLLAKLGRGPITVLYTNSTRTEANRSFPSFRKALFDAGFKLIADDTGMIEIERWAGRRNRPLRYALFQRQKRLSLRLERD